MSHDIYFLAEFADGKATRSALELAAGAQQLAASSGGAAVALAYGPGAAGAAALGAAGAARVVLLGDANVPAITLAVAAGAALRDAPLALLAPASQNGRDLAGALVGLLGLPAFGPVRAVSIDGGRVRTEQGTLQGTVITISEPVADAPQPAVVLLLAGTFTPLEGGSGAAPLAAAPEVDPGAFGRARISESHPAAAAVANLEEATVIVAGGRGVGSADGFAPLHELAAVLGGAVGASRAAADAGWVPYQLQIGQTGKVVKPALYIGCGISGAIQHRVGMQTAENVLAINKDPDAPIGEFADLFVVGDLFAIVPRLTAEIRRRKES